MNIQKKVMTVTVVAFVALLSSAIMLVYTKHQSRKLYVEVQQLKRQADELNTEWGQFQLEQSAWSDHGRIERVARTRLSMKMPNPDDVVFIKP